LALANITLVHRPWPREGVVHDGDFVVQDVRIALVEIDALLDNCLVVVMQRYAASLEGAWSLEIACLDLERVEAAVAIGVEPIADRIAHEARLVILWKIAPVRVDAPRHKDFEIHVGDIW